MTAVSTPLRVYLDEDVDVLVAHLLSTRGIDCLTTLAANNLGSTDEKQLEFADRESRVLITHNRLDFENLAVTWWSQQRDHTGIVLAVRRANAYELLRHLLPSVTVVRPNRLAEFGSVCVNRPASTPRAICSCCRPPNKS